MSDSIIQTKRFFKKCSIQLLKDKIKVIRSTPFDLIEFEISYENIETKKTIEAKVNFGLLVLISLLLVIGILYFFGDKSNISSVFFIVAIIIFFIAMATKLKVITIKTFEGHTLELFFTNKNKADVINFAEKIINTANNFLLSKYSKIDKDLPIENQLSKLDFLRDKELITDEVFEQLKNQLLGKENKQTIGYR